MGVEIVNIGGKNNLIHEAFRTLLDHTESMIFIKDVNLVYVAASAAFVKMVGKKNAEEIVGRTDHEIFDDESLAHRYVADDKKLLAQKEDLVDYIEPITDDNGQARYGSTSKYILRDDMDNFIGILGITRDITREYIARQHYQQELRYLFKLPKDAYAVTYIDVDSWRIISQRRQLIDGETLQSVHTVEEVCEWAVKSIVDKSCVAAEFYSGFSADFLERIYASGRSSLYFTYQRVFSDETIRWVYNEVHFLRDVDSGHLCVMLSAKDINNEKIEEQNLVVAAKMDKMTMLLNRETTMEYIKQALVNDAKCKHALFMIDIDNFKSLNDTLGHQVGDEFLIALAVELKNSFRESDIVGRIGGDEFFALMRKVPDVSAVTKKAEELLENIQRVCEKYSDIRLSASIGISLYPEHGRSLDELYMMADGALYQSKRNGKNQAIFAHVPEGENW